MKVYICRVLFTDGTVKTYHFTNQDAVKEFSNAMITHDTVRTLTLEDIVEAHDKVSNHLKAATQYANSI